MLGDSDIEGLTECAAEGLELNAELREYGVADVLTLGSGLSEAGTLNAELGAE